VIACPQKTFYPIQSCLSASAPERQGRLQESFARNTIDYRRVFEVMQDSDYKGWIGIEYVWIDWEHCNECDNLSETIQFRNFFLDLMER
jgi:hypothetical protein